MQINQKNKIHISKLWALYVTILLLPFLVFWWLLPGSGLTIGNDYPIFSIRTQMDLFYSIANKTFPLYLPSLWHGQSSSAAPLAQIYHPISWITYLIPGYWSKEALSIYTILKLLSLGVANLVLFFFFKRLSIGNVLAFIASFIVIYNLRMLDLFRYGASLEAYTGFIFLAVSTEYLYHDMRSFFKKNLVIGSTYLVVVSGHPQMSYYALLGTGIFIFLIPWLFLHEKENNPDTLKFIRTVLLLIATGVLLSSVFSLPFYFDYLQNNSTRALMSYQESLSYSGSTEGIYNNFLIPFRSNVHSAFGASSLFFMGTISIVLSRNYLTQVSTRILFTILLIATLVMLGDSGGLHEILWNYMPLYSSFRIPGRISFILPFFIILAYVLYLRYILDEQKNNTVLVTHIKISIAFVLLSSLSIFRLQIPPNFTSIHIRDITYSIELLYVVINTFLIIFIGIFISSKNRLVKYFSATLSILLVIISSTLVLYYGTWSQSYDEAVSENIKSYDEFDKGINPLGHLGFGLESSNTNNQLNNYKFDNVHARMVPKFILFEDLGNIYQYLNSNETLDHVVLMDTESDNREVDLCSENCSYRIERYCRTYNRYDYKITNNKPGIIKINIPFNLNWVATLNSNSSPVLSANGYETAIIIPNAGENILTLKYSSQSFLLGLFISLLTLSVIMALGIYRLKINKTFRVSIIILLITTLTTLYISHDNWLYDGNCLPGNYNWQKIYH